MQLDQPPEPLLAAQPLELMNRDELTDVIAAAQKTPESATNSHIEKNGEMI